MEINSHLVFAKLQAGHIPHWSNTTKTIGFYDTLTTSVLLNQCGIISSDNLVIIKLANKDGDVQTHLWIVESWLRWSWFHETCHRWRNIIVTCLEQHSCDSNNTLMTFEYWVACPSLCHSFCIVTQLSLPQSSWLWLTVVIFSSHLPRRRTHRLSWLSTPLPVFFLQSCDLAYP